MHNPLIKICGIRSAFMAQAAVRSGADFIGLVCHSSSKRFVDIELACTIAETTRAVNGVPVAVFVGQTSEQMRTFCQETGIEMVQLHGDRSRSEQHLLPDHYPRIYVCPVEETGPQTLALQGLLACDVQRDYVLFDHICPGSGQTFAWDKLDYCGPFRKGIAGGLNQANVRKVLQSLQPQLVDVSSGVEGVNGEKDIVLIREFVTAVEFDVSSLL